MRMAVGANLVVGFGELIPMESLYDNSEEYYISTVTKDNEEMPEK